MEDDITTPRLGSDAKGSQTTQGRKSKPHGSDQRTENRKLVLDDLKNDSGLKLRVLAELEGMGNGFEETLGQPTPKDAHPDHRRRLFIQGFREEVDSRLPDSLFNGDETLNVLAGDIPDSPEAGLAKEANQSQKMNFFKQTRDQEQPKHKQPTQRLRSPVIQKTTNRSFKEKKASVGAGSQSKPIMTTNRQHNSLKMNFQMAVANSSALRTNRSPATGTNKALNCSSGLDRLPNDSSLNSGKPCKSQVAQPANEPRAKSKPHSRTKSQHELPTGQLGASVQQTLLSHQKYNDFLRYASGADNHKSSITLHLHQTSALSGVSLGSVVDEVPRDAPGVGSMKAFAKKGAVRK